ncbi:MAG: hypothetical protein WA584_16385 [Pyrinomonadaceae bacterium]
MESQKMVAAILMLATLLFAVLTIWDEFLAKSTDSSLTTLENISRIA